MPRARLVSVHALAVALALVLPRAAAAQVSGASQAIARPAEGSAPVDALTVFDPPPTRRSGLVLGVFGGGGLAGSSGYPNNATQIDDPQYYAASGFMPGVGGNAMIMGALADYLNFGFWLGFQNYDNGDWRSRGAAGGFRVEAFPLYFVLPRLADLGVFTQLGVGTAKLDAKRGVYPGADGAQSFVGIGVFHEWNVLKLPGGHVAAGPSLEYDATFARSIDRHGMLAGLRLVFYGGP